MSDNYSQLEMALMELDRAVNGLARQAEGVKKTLAGEKTVTASSKKTAKQPDLLSLLANPPLSARVGNDFDLDTIERRLDATIAQIEDLLNDDFAVAGHG